VLWDEFQPFFLNCWVSNWKLISTRHEFNSNNFYCTIFTALKLWWEDWVSKLNSRLSFWGRLTALKNPWKNPWQYILLWFWQGKPILTWDKCLTTFRAHEQKKLSREICQAKHVDRTHEKVNLSRKICSKISTCFYYYYGFSAWTVFIIIHYSAVYHLF
jgi:hypothetical protein